MLQMNKTQVWSCKRNEADIRNAKMVQNENDQESAYCCFNMEQKILTAI